MAEAAAGARLDAAYNLHRDVELIGSSDGTYTLTINPQRLVRRFYRSIFRFNRKIQNTIWPFTPTMWVTGVTGIVVRVVTAPPGSWWRSGFLAEFLWKIDSSFPWQRKLPIRLRVAWLSFVASAVGLFGISTLQRTTMRLLLNYHGYMFLPRALARNPPWYVKAWNGAVRLLGGIKPSLYNFQGCLPTIPVPPLKQTCENFLLSVKPLVDDAKYQELEQKCQEFLNGPHGWKAQLLLKFRSLTKRSWLWDWWEQYVYLIWKDPIMINSNYYIMDGFKTTPTNRQAARAASFAFEADGFKKLIDDEQLEPVRKEGVPWCMKQYERLFDTTRTPGGAGDKIEHYEVDPERYVAVSSKGVWYKLPFLVRGKGGKVRPITLPELEKQFERIIMDSSKVPPSCKEEGMIAALTGWRRDRWAEARDTQFHRGVNMMSLEVVEKAAFVVHLDDRTPSNLDEQARWLMHGDGKSLWFDKSVSVIVFANGKGGLMCEHSYADALTSAHLWEWIMSGEQMHQHVHSPDGHTTKYSETDISALDAPTRLNWNMTEPLKDKINEAYEHNVGQINDLDLTLMQFEEWGNKFIKKMRCSPDAFAQMAMQLAYRMDSGGKIALTYESTVTRFFSHGRTETVRPLTIESKAFVDLMLDGGATSKQRAAALRKATDKHTDLYRKAMTGNGVDRHLFGLFLIMKNFKWDTEDDFITQAIKLPWTLSTSQSPQNQTKGRWDPNNKDKDMCSPGGGFGPVNKDGYGVSYMFPNDDCIFAHVSSKKSSGMTDSARFKQNIAKALNMIKKTLEEDAAASAAKA